jgi:hypothetical protein
MKEGLSLRNTGVMNRQSIAGALATGTHGTGINYPIMSDSVISLEIVLADGTVKTLSEADGDLFSAAKVHIGALGVVTKLTLSCIPKYSAWKRNPLDTIDNVIKNLDVLVSQNEHLLAWWVPYQDIVQMLQVNRTDYKVLQDVSDSTFARVAADMKMRVLGSISHFATMVPLHLVPRVTQYLLAPFFNFWYMAEPFYLADGYRGLLSGHPDCYDEMEYFLPSSTFQAAWKEFRQLIEDKQEILGVNLPVQLRMTSCDNILLSPFYQEDCKSKPTYFIAVALLCRGSSLNGYFHQAEEIFLRHGGRSHWGKTHFLGRKQLLDIYGDNFLTFLKLRDQLDPDGLFLNQHLKHLFFD